MTIQMTEKREQVIRSLLEAGKFSTADAVIDEALRLVGERYGAEEPPDRTSEQRENMRRLAKKLESMQTTAVADGLSNRDHDPILYGK